MAGETVTRIRPTESGVDRYGNPVFTDAEVDIPGAFFAPEQSSTELTQVGRVPVITKPSLYFPGAWPDLVASDRVRVRGLVFEVNGDPADWRNPWGGPLPGGLVVTLERVTG